MGADDRFPGSRSPDFEREPSPRRVNPTIRTAIVAVAAVGAVTAIGATAGWGLKAGVSVSVGSLIAAANLYGLARIGGALLGNRVEGEAAGIWGVLAIVKVVGLFGGVWLLLSAHLVAPLPLVLGWGALPVGIALGTAFGAAPAGRAGRETDRSIASRGKEAPPAGPPAAS